MVLQPDVVFLDADHGYEAVKADLKQLRRWFPGAVLIADDWDWETVRRGAVDAAAELGERIGMHGTAFRFFANLSEMAASPPLKQ